MALSTACFCLALLISVWPSRCSSSPDLIHDSAVPSGRTDPMALHQLSRQRELGRLTAYAWPCRDWSLADRIDGARRGRRTDLCLPGELGRVGLLLRLLLGRHDAAFTWVPGKVVMSEMQELRMDVRRKGRRTRSCSWH